jgi:tetratricopeptide (TPR) repeat protein
MIARTLLALLMSIATTMTIAAPSAPAQEPKPDPAKAGAEDREKEKDKEKAEDDGPEINPKDFIYTVDEAIGVFLARIKKNPNDNVSYQRLGELYERKAGETGDLASYEKAEAALRMALKLAPENHRARVSLAAVLCSRHKFAEGLTLASEALKQKPKDVDALATAGDALLETGRYDEAEAAFKDLHRLSKLPAVLSRLAGLAEFKGDPDTALALMKQAADDILKDGGTPKEAAWYVTRMGDIALTAGRVDSAEKYYASVPSGVDAFHDATAGLARIRAMQGKDAEAVELYEKAVAIGPDPHMLAALGDLHVKAGRPDAAAPLFDRVLKATEGKSEYLRPRAMFLADHDRDLPQALALAEEDYLQRKDVYGADALAWALYKNGRFADAAKLSADALRLNTRDANLYYHAGMIHARLGDAAKAREYLSRALKTNPRFSPLHADEARATLERLDVPDKPAGKS